MTLDQIKENLCYKDLRNPDATVDGETAKEIAENNTDCYCDNCFSGKTALAEELLKYYHMVSEEYPLVPELSKAKAITSKARSLRKEVEIGSDPHNTQELSLELHKAARLIAQTLDKIAGKSEERHRGATFTHRLRHAWRVVNK